MRKYSEMFAYHAFAVSVPVQSKIVPGKITQAVIGFRCPRCSTQNKKLSHGDKVDCVACGLQMQLYGNGLEATINIAAHKKGDE